MGGDPIGEMFIRVLPDTKAFAPAVAAQTGAATNKAVGGISTVSKVGLAATVAVGAGLFAMGKEADAAFDSIKVATGATGDALKQLEDDAKAVASNIPVSFQEAADAIGIINTDLGLTGEQGQAAAESILEASRLLGEDGTTNTQRMTRALKQWGIEADAIPGFMDTAFAATQKYGVSLESLSGNLTTYGSILNNAGFSSEEAVEFFGQLEQSGISVSRVMPALNKAMRDWADEGITDVQGELMNTVDAIAGAETEMEALQIATEVFGAQGAQRFSQAIRDGNLSLEDLGAQLGDTSGRIEDTADETDSAAEAFQKMKNRIFLAIEPAATKFFKSLGETVEALAPAIETVVAMLVPLLEVFAAIPAPVQAVVLGGLAFGAVLSKIVPGVLAVIKVVKLLSLALMSNPIVLIIAAIAGAAFLIYKNWEPISEFFKDLWEDVTEIFEEVVEVIGDVLETLGDVFSEAWDVIKGVVQGALDFIETITRPWVVVYSAIFSFAFNAISTFIETWVGRLQALFSNLFNWLTNAAEVAMGVFRTVWETAVTAVTAVINVGVAAWQNVIMPFLQAMQSAFQTAWGVVQSIFQTAWGVISSVVSTGVGLVRGLLDTLLGPIGGIGGALETMRDVFSSVWDRVKQIMQDAYDFVKRMADNIKDAVSDALGPVGDIAGAAGGLLGGAANLLGFDTGGVVPGPRGAPQLAMVHGGETILPTHKKSMNDLMPSGGGGMTVQGPLLAVTGPVTVRSDDDITQLSRAFAREAARTYRAAGEQTGGRS